MLNEDYRDMLHILLGSYPKKILSKTSGRPAANRISWTLSISPETTHDPFGTFDQAVAMSDALPNSRIRVIERCGHTPIWKKPAEFAGIVAEFLKTSGLPSSQAGRSTCASQR